MMRQTASVLVALSWVVGGSCCTRSGEQCSLWNRCCGSLQCKEQGFLKWRCVGLQPRCMQEGQTCGGPGLADSTCCDGMQCEHHLLGTANQQCMKPQPQCIQRGQICGCVGCLTQTCCDEAQCADVSGQGGKKYCVDLAVGSFVQLMNESVRTESFVEQCAPEGETCGGPGLPNSSCCGGLECKQHLLGTANKQCVRPQPQCIQEGQTCGGPGLADSACCDGMQCERHLFGTANRQCVKPQPQCIQHGQICGCVGCLTQTCCDGAQCTDVSGQGGKQYCGELVGASLVVVMNNSDAMNSTDAEDEGSLP